MMFMTFLRARTVEGPGVQGRFFIYNSNGVGNMEKRYIIGIDQSTQGTKALLFDGEGHLLRRTDLPHRQIVNEKGWVSHDLNEIYRNTVQTVKTLVAESGVAPEEIAGIGISNQRETTAIWDKATGEPLEEAIVWQCGRASGIAQEIAEQGHAEEIREATGLQLSAYFPAAKMAWLLRNRNVPQTGSSALVPSTAGWFTS